MLRFFINLDSSKDRCENIKKRLSELKLSFERISAVNGAELDDEYCESLQYPKNDRDIRARYTRQLKRGEIGCFLSHIKCWQRLVESDENYAVIIEDALIVSDRAAFYLNDESWIPDDVDIVRLCCDESSKIHIISKDRKALNTGDELIIQLKPKPLGTMGYIISKKAAAFALSISKKLPSPVDDFLFTPLFQMSNTYPSWQLNPSIIRRDYDKKSVIGNRSNKDLSELKAPFYIRHGFKRWYLKHQVKRKVAKGIETSLTFK